MKKEMLYIYMRKWQLVENVLKTKTRWHFIIALKSEGGGGQRGGGCRVNMTE